MIEKPLPSRDVRMRGFTDRVSVAHATAWIDAQAALLPAETIDLARAAGRVLAAAVEAPDDRPPSDMVAEDGYALRAAETIGAGDYNPLTFALQRANDALRSGAAIPVVAGAALPAGADAIVPFGQVQPSGTSIDVFGVVAAGSGIEPRARQAVAGTVLIAPGRYLRADHIGLIGSLGLDRVRVVREPRVSLIVAGPKSSLGGAAHDALGPMLRGLVRRDGGIVSRLVTGAADRAALIAAMTTGSIDAILVAGRSGTGSDDAAPPALAAAGELAMHGIALRPGGSAGLGRVNGVPVALLPGDPLACLVAYEFLGGRLIRRLGGRDPDGSHAVRQIEVGRKIVSEIGSVDVCLVRCVGERVEPIGSRDAGGLASAVRADGFVVVPAHVEGHAPGARVAVRLFAGCDVTQNEEFAA